MNDLRKSNTTMADKIEAADDFFDIPHSEKIPDPKIEEVKSGGYRPSGAA